MKLPTEYELWKQGHMLTLRAFTEEEVFDFGYEIGRKAGMKQEHAMWQLQSSTPEIQEAITVVNKLAEKIVKQINEKAKLSKNSTPK